MSGAVAKWLGVRTAAGLVAAGLALQIPAVLDTTPPTFLLLGLAGVPLVVLGAILGVREAWTRGPRS